MSAVPPDERRPQPTSRAAELVAQQVEKIVEAARTSAERVTAAAQREAAEIKSQARESAQTELAEARRNAIRLSEEARAEAEARIAEAQAASDEALAEAKAVSSGLRQLAQLLTVHAERILRDVDNSHRAIASNLRVAGAGGARSGVSDRAAEADVDAAAAPAPRRGGAAGGGNPFEDLEPPAWVEEAGGSRRKRGA